MPRTKFQFEEIRRDKASLIKESAMQLFANLGYHSTSITMIAKHANISKGLLYNYFESKESLLKFIFYDIVENVMSKLFVSSDKPELFINKFFDVVIENPKEWKLFFQLAMQQEVMEILMNENLSDNFVKYQNLLFRYFVDHEFDDLHVTILHFSSVYKGFAMSYVWAPQLFDKSTLDSFKACMIEMFERPKRKVPLKNVEIDEFMGYLLM